MYVTSCQSRFDARYWMLGDSALEHNIFFLKDRLSSPEKSSYMKSTKDTPQHSNSKGWKENDEKMFCQENNNKNFCRSMLISGKHILNDKKNREKLSDYVNPLAAFFFLSFFWGVGTTFCVVYFCWIHGSRKEVGNRWKTEGKKKYRCLLWRRLLRAK